MKKSTKNSLLLLAVFSLLILFAGKKLFFKIGLDPVELNQTGLLVHYPLLGSLKDQVTGQELGISKSAKDFTANGLFFNEGVEHFGELPGWAKSGSQQALTYTLLLDLGAGGRESGLANIFFDGAISDPYPRASLWVKEDGGLHVSIFTIGGRASFNLPKPPDSPVHVALVTDARKEIAAVYFNGAVIEKSVLPGVLQPAQQILLSRGKSPATGAAVRISELAVWSRSLDAQEIAGVAKKALENNSNLNQRWVFYWATLGSLWGLALGVVIFWRLKKQFLWVITKVADGVNRVCWIRPENRLFYLYSALFALVALLVYLPAFLLDFGIHNDYDPTNVLDLWMVHPEARDVAGMGRLLNGLVLSLQFYFIQELSDLAVARFYAAMVTIFNVLLLASILWQRVKLEAKLAVAIGATLFFLPGFQLYILWVTNFPNTLSFTLGLLAYWVWDQHRVRGWNLTGNLTLALAGQGLLLCSFMTYPANTFAFLLPVTARILFTPLNNWRKNRIILAQDMAFIGFSAPLYFVVYKYLIGPFLTWAGPVYWGGAFTKRTGHYSMNLLFNWEAKWLTFERLSKLTLAGPLHLIGWEKTVHLWVLGVTGLLAFALLLVYLVQGPAKEYWRVWTQLVLGLAGIVLLVNAPYLLVEDVPTAYRITLIYGALLVLLYYWLIWQWASILGGGAGKNLLVLGLGVLLATYGLIGARNVLYVSIEKKKELDFIRARLRSEDLSVYRKILLIGAPMMSHYLDREIALDFNLAASQMYYTFNLPLIKFGLEGTGYKLGQFRVEHIGIKPENVIKRVPIPVTDDGRTLMINFNELSLNKEVNWKIPADQAREQNSSRGFYQSIWGLPQDPQEWYKKVLFRQAPLAITKIHQAKLEQGVPFWIRIELPEISRKNRYKLGPGLYRDQSRGPEQMPRNWKVFGSVDGVDWQEVDHRSAESWSAGETRVYDFVSEKAYRFYLIRFAAGDAPDDQDAVEFSLP